MDNETQFFLLLASMSVLLIPVFFIIAIFVVTWAWNASVAEMFSWPHITKKQAFALLLLFCFLGAGFTGAGQSSKVDLSRVSDAIRDLEVEVSSMRQLLEKSLDYGSRKIGQVPTGNGVQPNAGHGRDE
jgi:hypothetical protein